MRAGEIERRLSAGNLWWRTSTATVPGHEDDRDLRDARADIDCEPRPLRDIEPDGLALLLDPAR